MEGAFFFVRFGGNAAKTNEINVSFRAAAACPELVEGAKNSISRCDCVSPVIEEERQ
jgi:hypothetical protein